jgi:hypothetical protein
VLRASLAGEAELVRAGWRVRAGPRDVGAAARALGRLSNPESAATEGALLAALAAYCDQALAGYPSTLAQDEEEAARLEAEVAETSEQQQPRPFAEQTQQQQERHLRLQVLRALIAEKRCLTGTAAAVSGWQARLAAGCPPGELYEGLDGSGDDEDGGSSDW